ncbi:MAG: sulfite exporter TauE/SafE family protein [Proteobacteria bacterium]|nr:sulfite exporter TauE/SafE family protein [Pseudomonadota bacterium]NOG61721.1 sulfite exporter TauE/SafE family protein [Pseudomonadota bacterium]
MDFSFTIIGFAVGFVVGMTGVGGGSLMTPILVLGFHIQPAVAVGTDLLYAAITKTGGVFVHHKHGNIQWKILSLLFMGSVPASLCSILIIKKLDSAGVNYDNLIMTTLSIALILTGVFLLSRNQLNKLSKEENSEYIKALHLKYRKPTTIFAGALIGVLVTLSSVGAGVIGAAFLFFLYPRYKAIKIVATDIAHAVPITAIAGIGHAHIGTVDFILLGNLIVGSLPGIYLGSKFGTFLPDKAMRPILACMLLAIGIRLGF